MIIIKRTMAGTDGDMVAIDQRVLLIKLLTLYHLLGRSIRVFRALTSGQKRPKCRNKRKTNQQKMWNTMKISRFFTLTDLMLTAETGQKQAWFYTDRLVKAGYVKVLFKVDSLLPVPARHGLTGRYQLVRDTGRYAPLCRDHGCWDQNQQQLYPFQREEETHGNVA